MNPSRAKNAIATAPLAAVNRGLRNRLTSIIGLAVTRSAATSRPTTAAPAVSVPIVAADAQPQPGRRQGQATPVEPRGARVAGGGHPPDDQRPDHGRHRDEEQEDAAPPV